MVSFRITPTKEIALVLDEGDAERLRSIIRKNFPNAEARQFAHRLLMVLENAEDLLARSKR